MNRDRWRQIDRVCRNALEREPRECAAFLDDACAGDTELRREVESLMAQRSSAQGFLETPASYQSALTPGTRLGPYEITSRAGIGGMGEVYKARDTRLGRTVAIKVLPSGLASDPERRRRFEHEARAVSALNHPNICTLHDIGSDRGVDFLVMEFLEGQTLAERLRTGALPFAEALECGAQIADALGAAHHHGIVHRDLKPANVMLTKSGAKLLDFGLAKLNPLSVTSATAHRSAVATQEPTTTPGTVLGTVPYMAPEQLEGKETDARADLFAFGCLLYEMLTGRRAFEGDTEASIIAAIMSSQPPHVSSLRPAAPSAIDRLVERCLQKDPNDRAESARDIAEELRGIRTDSDASRVSAGTAPPRPVLRRAVAASAVLIVAIAAGWFAIDRLSRSPTPQHFSLTMPAGTVFYCGSSTCIAAASDGSGVVYEGGGAGAPDLYWYDLAGSGTWVLTNRSSTPFLSPDGRWLGFVRDQKIFKLPLQQGRVMEGTPASEISPGPILRGASWGDDGTIVFAKPSGGLWQVSANGGVPRQITQLDSSKYDASHRFPSFLPGGRTLLFEVDDASRRPDRSALAVLSLDTGRWARIIEGGTYGRYLRTGHIVYARYGSLFAVPFNVKTLTITGTPLPVLSNVWGGPPPNNAAFDVAGNGTLVYVQQLAEPPKNELVSVDREGRLEPVAPERRAYDSELSLSADGQRLAVTVETDDHDWNCWVYHLQGRRWQQLTVRGRCGNPIWSPAGDRVAFTWNRDGPDNLYVMPLDREGVQERLTNTPNQQWSDSWSPDGRFLAYGEQDPNPAPESAALNTWIVALDGNEKPRLLEMSAVVPAFSPDGRWLAYTSARASEPGRFDLYIRPFPGPGPKQLISGTEGGFGAVWSRDGPTIFYAQRLGDTRIMSRRVESSDPLRLAEPRVAFALPFSMEATIPVASRTFTVTPDGQRVITVRMDRRRPPAIDTLQVIRNWPEEVKAMLRGGK